MSWTDEELRAAIDKAERPSVAVILRTNVPNDRTYYLDSLRRILTALGIDHQPKPELPTEPGSVIYDAVDDEGHTYRVMVRGLFSWCGANEKGEMGAKDDTEIVSFGGVLDLDKVRGEQDE